MNDRYTGLLILAAWIGGYLLILTVMNTVGHYINYGDMVLAMDPVSSLLQWGSFLYGWLLIFPLAFICGEPQDAGEPRVERIGFDEAVKIYLNCNYNCQGCPLSRVIMTLENYEWSICRLIMKIEISPFIKPTNLSVEKF